MKLNLKFACPETRKSLTQPDGTLHCDSCQKRIQDFTSASSAELLNVMQKKEATCGIFHRSQLSPSFLKSAVAALLISATSGCHEKIIEPAMNNSIIPDEESEVLEFVGDVEVFFQEEYPEPLGENENFRSAIREIIENPGTVEGKVFVELTVSPQGKIISYRVLRGINESFDQMVVNKLKELDYPFKPSSTELTMIIPIAFGL